MRFIAAIAFGIVTGLIAQKFWGVLDWQSLAIIAFVATVFFFLLIRKSGLASFQFRLYFAIVLLMAVSLIANNKTAQDALKDTKLFKAASEQMQKYKDHIDKK